MDFSKAYMKILLFLVDTASQNGHMPREKMRLPSVSSALLLASGIGIVEAIGIFFGSGILLSLMGVPTVSLYILVHDIP